MARRELTIPMTEISEVSELVKRIQAFNVPKNTVLHLWYSTETTSPQNEVKPEKKLSPQLAALVGGFQSFGGFTSEEAEEIKRHSKEFREGFEI